jgi:hypothetical protein
MMTQGTNDAGFAEAGTGGPQPMIWFPETQRIEQQFEQPEL